MLINDAKMYVHTSISAIGYKFKVVLYREVYIYNYLKFNFNA